VIEDAMNSLFLLAALASVQENPSRRIAITIDDLPFVSASALAADEVRTRTTKLLDHLERRAIPAVGFVIERKLFESGSEDPERTALLDLWLDSGMELGNHTYSHLDLHETALPEFQEDVLRGEVVTRRLLTARSRRLRYFRHPLLHTGTDLESKAALEGFLRTSGYQIAPVTVDNHDFLFARAYDRADELGRVTILESYLRYMAAVVEYYEAQSRAILGYELPQILLLHANTLNADGLGRLADSLAERGYTFVPLEEALRDPAFSFPDEYFGPAGISWLHRWAITRGLPKSTFAGEPEPGEFLPELK
jgi:peptidoglycan/xylan/chitin deacetylase (PgdA/CDA1 family)